MLEERGIVVKVDEQFATVQTQRLVGCGQCATKAGCGTNNLAEMFGRKYTEIKVANLPAVKVGDTVILGLEEQALVRSALVLYLMPLLGLLAGALAYEMVTRVNQWPHLELLTILSGLIGFAVTLFWVKRLSLSMSSNPRYQPVILEIVAHLIPPNEYSPRQFLVKI